VINYAAYEGSPDVAVAIYGYCC